ncbi:MAG: ABC transporter substrate-binding protein [Alphaproteobacteria bacterium]|nr:ABC transporter substrate-binding protein [Alphaproteobacteria bacterium]
MRLRILVAGLLLLVGAAGAAAQPAFRYAASQDVETMDPVGRFGIFTLGFLHAIYEPLVRYDRDLKLEPALATAWTRVDATTWRFTLREGVRFHDGSALTAADVVFSIERGKAEGSAMAATLAPVAAAVAIDARTVELVLARPQPTLLNDLAFVFIMSRRWAEANNSVKPTNLRANALVPAHGDAMGTGPFRLVRREADTRTELAPNPAWWDRPAKPLPRVEFRPIRAAGTRIAALLSGEVDFIDPLPLQDVARIQAAGGFTVRQAAELRTLFLGMDQARPELLGASVKGANPFKDPRVRRAIYQAIDIGAIRERVMRGAADVTGSMVGPGVVGYEPGFEPRLPFDVDAARRLMAEAGYASGFSVGFDCPNDRWVNDEAICQAIVPMLARIGIMATLDAQPGGRYLNKVLNRETALYLLGWTPGNNDAFDVIKPIMAPREGAYGLFNIGGYANPRVTELAKAIEVEADGAKRLAMIREAIGLHAADIGHVPLHRQYTTWAHRRGIEVVQRADGVLPLWQVHVP